MASPGGPFGVLVPSRARARIVLSVLGLTIALGANIVPTPASAAPSTVGAAIRINASTTNPGYQTAVGAAFALEDLDGAPIVDRATGEPATLVVGTDGLTPLMWVDAEEDAAVFARLVETSAPPGLVPVPPRTIELTEGAITGVSVVHDVVAEATITVHEHEALGGASVAGATVRVDAAPHPDGPFSEPLPGPNDDRTWTLTTEPLVLDGLRKGQYLVTQVSPAPDHQAEEWSTIVQIEWDGAADIDRPVALVPTIDTHVSDAAPTFGAPIHDVVTLGRLADAAEGTLTIRVFGPAPDGQIPDVGCEPFDPTGPIIGVSAGEPLPAIATWTVPVHGSGTYESPDWVPPSEGTFTFVATLQLDGVPEWWDHPCGLAPQTANVAAAPPTTTTTPSVPTTAGPPTFNTPDTPAWDEPPPNEPPATAVPTPTPLPVTGSATTGLASIGMALLVSGAAAVASARRARRTGVR